MKGLQKALAMAPADIVEEGDGFRAARTRRRRFPDGHQMEDGARYHRRQKYIVCNADEGDSGTFADRMIMEGDPFVLIEGMAIAGIAVGATKGYVYFRSEYPHAHRDHERGNRVARRAGVLGQTCSARRMPSTWKCASAPAPMSAARRPRCSKSLEGKRGIVRAKPPLPAHKGLFGKPTVINNVISLASVPIILDKGGAFYKDFGIGRSRGTIPIQIAGNVKHGGLFETAFGLTLGEIVDEIGGGTVTGRPVKAVQVGGPLGAYFPRALFDTPFDYEAFAAKDGLIGHAGIVVFDDSADMLKQARFAMEFCAIESCGKCTPCRIGSTRGVEVVDRIAARRRAGKADRASHRPLQHDEIRIALRARGFHPISSDERANPFSGRLSPITRRRSRGIGTTAMNAMFDVKTLIEETDYGTPASASEKTVTLTIDGRMVTVPDGTSIMRAAMDAGWRFQSSARPTCSTPSAPAASAWSRSKAVAGRPPPAPRRSPRGWW